MKKYNEPKKTATVLTRCNVLAYQHSLIVHERFKASKSIMNLSTVVTKNSS